jgi:hypothetical protein
LPTVASWILNFTKGGAKLKKQLPQQAQELVRVGLWGIPPTAQAKDKLAAGDRVLVYVGAPDRVFVGRAGIAAPWHAWSADESAKYPMTSSFAAGIALRDGSVWDKPVPLTAVWPQTEGANTNPKALWYGAAVRVAEADYDLIARAGAAAATGQSIESIAAQPSPPAAVAQTGEPSPSTMPGPGSSPPPTPASPSSSDGLAESAALFTVAVQLRKFLTNPKPLNEASTRAFFLDKVFDALGYSEFDDIEHGSVVQTGDFPDYVLHAGGMPAIAVEAKKIDHPLGPKEAGQVVKYCSVLGLRWGLLTNGRLFQIYDAPVTGIAPEDRLVLEIDLNDWADREDFDLRRWSEATMLTKAAMETGDALERYAAREMIRTLLLDPSARTVKALRKELEGKKVVLSEPTITSLIGELLT